jgi:diguanylate cyclase (GGDEF)-like protein/PAS domain S-box-containing protein
MTQPSSTATSSDEKGEWRSIPQVDAALGEIRSRLVNASLIVICIFALPAIAGVVVRSADIGWSNDIYLYGGAYSAVVIITVLRNRLPFRLRAFMLLAVWFAIGTTSLFMWGLAGNGIPFLVTGCIFTTLLLGLKTGLLTIIGTIAVMTGIWLGVDHWSGTRQAELAIYLSSHATWGVRIAACSMMMAIIVASLEKLHGAMAAALRELYSRSSDLEDMNRRLEKEIQERRQAEQSLLESETQLRSLYENIPVGVFRTTPEGRLLSANPAFIELNGYGNLDEMKGVAVSEMYVDPDVRRNYVAELDRHGVVKDREIKFRRKDGSTYWASVTSRRIAEPNGKFVCLDGILQDVTERHEMSEALKAAHDQLERRVAERTEALSKAHSSLEALNSDLESAIQRANQMTADAEIRNYELEIEMQKRRRTESALRESERKYRSIIENIAEGYCELDQDGRFVFFNDAMCTMLGYTREELTGTNTLDLLLEEDAERVSVDFARACESGTALSGYCYRIVRKDGRSRQMESTMSPILSEGGQTTGLRGLVRDVEDRKKYEDKLIYMAYHDPLTDLLNRKAFYAQLDKATAYAQRYRTTFSLVYIDIDKFKQANDTLGHEAGDLILKAVAERLTRCLRDTDIVARLGGDEFAVILNNPDNALPNPAAERMARELSAPYPVAGAIVDYISASIGISRFPQDATDPNQLVKFADAAMYRQKKSNRRTPQPHLVAPSDAPPPAG